MPEQIMAASGGPLWHINAGGAGVIIGSVETAVSLDTSSYVSVVGSPNYSLPIIGSVEITNADIEVNVAVSDYVSIVGSPDYSLPIIGSVEVSNTVTVDASDLDIRDLSSASDSVAVVGSVEVSNTARTVTQVRDLLGSVAVSNFPATQTVDASSLDIRALSSASDSVSAVGSVEVSNWNTLGSVEVSNFPSSYTVSATNLDIRALSSASDSVSNVGSVEVSNYTGSVHITNAADISLTAAGSVVLWDGTNTVSVTDNKLDVNATTSVSFDAIAAPDTQNAPGSIMNIGGIDVTTGSMSRIIVNSDRLEVDATNAGDVPVTLDGEAVVLGAGTALIGSVLGIKEAVSVNALPAGTALIGSVLGIKAAVSVNALPAGTAKIGSICGISESLPVGNNVIGSVWAKVTEPLPAGTNAIGKLAANTGVDIGDVDVTSIAAGTNKIGSVLCDVTKLEHWNNVGSVITKDEWYVGSHVAFDWTTAVTASGLWIPGSGKKVNITDITCSTSGACLVTLYFDTDTISNRIFKSSTVAGGGYVVNYTRPFVGPTNGSVEITTTPATNGYIVINGFES